MMADACLVKVTKEIEIALTYEHIAQLAAWAPRAQEWMSRAERLLRQYSGRERALAAALLEKTPASEMAHA
jgi:hypothetical protein